MIKITRERIYSIALMFFNMDYSKIEDGFEKELCEEFIDASEEFCISSADWTFLMQRHIFSSVERIDGSYMDLQFGYTLPSDMFSICFVNGKYNSDFAIRGQNVFFHEQDPAVDYITSNIDYESFPYPRSFAFLIASQLAIKIAPMLSPDAQLENRISQQYAIYYSQLSTYNMKNRRKMNPSTADMVSPHGNNRFNREIFN